MTILCFNLLILMVLPGDTGRQQGLHWFAFNCLPPFLVGVRGPGHRPNPVPKHLLPLEWGSSLWWHFSFRRLWPNFLKASCTGVSTFNIKTPNVDLNLPTLQEGERRTNIFMYLFPFLFSSPFKKGFIFFYFLNFVLWYWGLNSALFMVAGHVLYHLSRASLQP